MALATQFKKLACNTAIALTLTTCTVDTALAANGDAKEAGNMSMLLTYIANYTYYTLKAVNNLPVYLNTITTEALSWLSPDNSEVTANLQYDFTKLTNQTLQNARTQNSLQQQISQEFIGLGVTPEMLPFANDITFQTVLGTPFFNPDPRKNNRRGGNQNQNVNPAFNYIKNAAGINLTHALPDPTWRGSVENQNKYKNYFQSVAAIQSYNGYVLSKLYIDHAKESQLSDLQQKLIQQASNSDWFVQVASENLGIVLRQILMYNSQMYVVLSQLLEIQKQQLAAQAMTNTLLVVSNESDEEMMLNKAVGG